MGKPTQTLAAETEALKQAYAALNRNDIPALVRILDPQIELIEPPDFPAGGTYRGIAAVTEHASQARAKWAEGACRPERFIAGGDKVVVFVHVHVRLKDETEWRDGKIADAFTFRSGKVVQWRIFIDRRQALQWAGVDASAAV
jgi:uncharacterized protein